MFQKLLALILLFSTTMRADAQLGVMKWVGPGSSKYDLGFGGFVKGAYPITDGADVTLEVGANIFLMNDGYGSADGTIMVPLKAGYRYTLDGSGTGFYVEPQIGFNVLGVTSLHDANGNQVNLNYHGVVFAAGAGFLFTKWNAPFDLNLRYETTIDHGGSNNFISLGISRTIRFGHRDSGY